MSIFLDGLGVPLNGLGVPVQPFVGWFNFVLIELLTVAVESCILHIFVNKVFVTDKNEKIYVRLNWYNVFCAAAVMNFVSAVLFVLIWIRLGLL